MSCRIKFKGRRQNDCRFDVEGIYSHLLFAKQIVANVLIDKVKDGYLTEAEAIKIARMLLHDNAVRILNLAK